MRARAFVVLCVLSSCTTRAMPASGPTIGSAPALEASCSPDASALRLVARDTRFDRTCLAAPMGATFTIDFVNADRGINHNVDILPAPFGYNRPPPSLFFGAIVAGPRDVAYRVAPLPAGFHFLVCYVHHDVMYAGFAVPPVARATANGIDVEWAPTPPATGFVFDVEVRAPGSTAWRAWRTSTTDLGGTYVNGRAYSFRVSEHRAGFGPLSWSPPATA